MVFLATGATADHPQHQGHRPARTWSAGGALHKKLKLLLPLLHPVHAAFADQVLHAGIGKNVVVIGGALQGCELAEFLVKRGRNVTIVEQADMTGRGDGRRRLFSYLMIWFEKKGVEMLITGVKEFVEHRPTGA